MKLLILDCFDRCGRVCKLLRCELQLAQLPHGARVSQHQQIWRDCSRSCTSIRAKLNLVNDLIMVALMFHMHARAIPVNMLS